MRLGVYLPVQDGTGRWLNGAEVAAQARTYEAAEIDSGWLGDHLPLPGDAGRNLPDPFMWLLLAAQATTDLELGTCAFCVPLRTPYDVAQRLYSLQTLFPDRFTIGVATGSQEREYEANGLVWEERFSRMHDHMTKASSSTSVRPRLRSPMRGSSPCNAIRTRR
jgi:alkanesulfonate monooxygenase SsuD/methylene tetrahydromethanopterin reductase-like flavin-dependent oxidoreductase (luciferase family)